jgi:archaellin
MKKTISILILLILIPTLCFAGSLQEKQRQVIAKKNVVAGGSETIGQESQMGSTGYYAAGYMYCYKLEETPGHNGSVDSITTTLNASGGSSGIRLSIYTHDVSNNIPATVLANSGSSEITVTSSSLTDVTFTYTGTKPAVTSGTQYWACVSNSGSTNNAQYTYADTGSTRIVYKSITHGTFPDWAGASDGGTDSRVLGKLYFTSSW